MIPRLVETRFFDFESDFVGSLKCIPMIVRYKLDACRVKLKLSDWVKFSYREKEMLAHLACCGRQEVREYADLVNSLAWKYTGQVPSMLADVHDTWTVPLSVPEEVNAKAVEWECAKIGLDDWVKLDLLERFALVKLSRSGHEGANFPLAVKEFFAQKPANWHDISLLAS